MTLRIGIDVTPAAVQEAGIGRYARGLLEALARIDRENKYALLYPGKGVSAQRAAMIAGLAFQHTSVHRPPVSALTLTRLWQRLRLPVPYQALMGRCDVFLGLDFTLPPLAGTPSVVTVYDLAFLTEPASADPRLRAFLTKATQQATRRATRVLTISDHARDTIARLLSVPVDHITVAPPAIDALFRAAPDLAAITRVTAALHIQPPYLLAVGTLQPRKNLERLVAAFVALRARYPTLSLVLAGSRGWLESALFTHIHESGLSQAVTVVESPTDDQLRALYHGAEVFVFPSLYEGFGIPVLEAMACGTPVVCSNSSSLPQAAGDAALLIDPRHTDEMVMAIERLLTDTHLRQMMIARGQAQAARFTWEATARAALSCLTGAVAEARQR